MALLDSLAWAVRRREEGGEGLTSMRQEAMSLATSNGKDEKERPSQCRGGCHTRSAQDERTGKGQGPQTGGGSADIDWIWKVWLGSKNFKILFPAACLPIPPSSLLFFASKNFLFLRSLARVSSGKRNRSNS
jgi:hypothetical protein